MLHRDDSRCTIVGRPVQLISCCVATAAMQSRLDDAQSRVLTSGFMVQADWVVTPVVAKDAPAPKPVIVHRVRTLPPSRHYCVHLPLAAVYRCPCHLQYECSLCVVRSGSRTEATSRRHCIEATCCCLAFKS